MSQFTIGQKLEGDGLAFEVVQVEPVVRVKCLEVSKFWRSIRLDVMPNNTSVRQETWEVGKEYELRASNFSSTAGCNTFVAVNHLLPWHVFFTKGFVEHYR